MSPTVIFVVLGATLLGGFLLTASANASPISGKLSPAKIAGYASRAGFSGDDLITAVAVALAESSGNPRAHGDLSLPGEGSFGLWQIYSKAHPEYGPDFTRLFDPETNADAAFDTYTKAGRSFRPWSTFKNGAYTAHLDAVNAEVNA